VVAMPSLPEHGDRHFRIDYVLGAHVKAEYVGSTDLITRFSSASDFATDTCIRRSGEDPKTGERYLEELAFEVVHTQPLKDIRARAEDLTKLVHLNESSVVHSLRQRYGSSLIHTYAGPALLVFNPMQPINLYSDKVSDRGSVQPRVSLRCATSMFVRFHGGECAVSIEDQLAENKLDRGSAC